MASRNNQKPNIVFILSDDQGQWALGSYGNYELKTPHLDKLTENGVRYENFFCASPVCSPARASILTGKIPSQHGVQDWIRGGNLEKDGIDYLDGVTAYTDVLASNGYECGLSGKWHCGNSFIPQKGFSHWYAHQSGSGDYMNPPMVRNGVAVTEKGYVSDLITHDAINFIENNNKTDKPFYLSLHFTAPHNPWGRDQHPEEFLKMYDDCEFKTAIQETQHEEATFKYTKEDARDSLIGYYASITAMDYNIGKLLKRIEELKLTENTLVIFTTDNGYNCGQHGIWGKGNGTFSLNMYDTSIKVPTIIAHKGVIDGGKVSNSMLSHYDIFPTLLEYCGITNYADKKLPGKSFCKELKLGEAFSGDIIMVYDEYGPARMIRTKEWKYVHRYPHGKCELFDLVNDKGETTNCILDQDKQNVVINLRKKMTEWFLNYVDPKIDAAKEPVRGNGQICRPGIYSLGKVAFDQNRKLNTDPKVDPGTVDQKLKQGAIK